LASTRPSSGRDEYLLGSQDAELHRLAFQHRVWAEQAFALWSRAGFRRGATILDLGCGPGFTAVDLAHLVGPTGNVLAVDSSERFLDHLRLRAAETGLAHIRTMHSDVHDLDLEPESLDGAYARWLFCFLRDPATVVEQVARALRPGGTLAVTDYFNYRAFTFAPRSAILDRVVGAVQECWRQRGGDLEIQGRMPRIMRSAGLDVIEVSQSCRVAEPGSPLWDWPLTFFQSFLPTLEQADLITPEERRAFEREWEERAQDPATRLFVPPMIDVVGIKPS
jgi:SAM-dependent methyltransferase